MSKDSNKSKKYLTFFVLYVIIALFVTLFGNSGILALRGFNRKYEGIMSNISAIKSENKKLAVEVDKLKTSELYIEELARKEFGMVKEGEIVFLFQD